MRAARRDFEARPGFPPASAQARELACELAADVAFVREMRDVAREHARAVEALYYRARSIVMEPDALGTGSLQAARRLVGLVEVASVREARASHAVEAAHRTAADLRDNLRKLAALGEPLSWPPTWWERPDVERPAWSADDLAADADAVTSNAREVGELVAKRVGGIVAWAGLVALLHAGGEL